MRVIVVIQKLYVGGLRMKTGTPRIKMSQQSTGTPTRRWISISSLVVGLAGLLCTVLFFATEAGGPMLAAGVVCGAVAVVLGIVAVVMRRPNGMAVTGVVTGAVALLLGAAIFVFALLFVGALAF